MSQVEIVRTKAERDEALRAGRAVVLVGGLSPQKKGAGEEMGVPVLLCVPYSAAELERMNSEMQGPFHPGEYRIAGSTVVWASHKWDPERRNVMKEQGAYVAVPPSDEDVMAAARELAAQGEV